jgi:hypothetical protein
MMAPEMTCWNGDSMPEVTFRRRIIPVAAMVLFLLPMTSASAAPFQRSETSLAVRLADWSRTILAPVRDLLQQLRPIFEADFHPPGQQPGNDHKPPSSDKHEGSGSDPHGKP